MNIEFLNRIYDHFAGVHRGLDKPERAPGRGDDLLAGRHAVKPWLDTADMASLLMVFDDYPTVAYALSREICNGCVQRGAERPSLATRPSRPTKPKKYAHLAPAGVNYHRWKSTIAAQIAMAVDTAVIEQSTATGEALRVTLLRRFQPYGVALRVLDKLNLPHDTPVRYVYAGDPDKTVSEAPPSKKSMHGLSYYDEFEQWYLPDGFETKPEIKAAYGKWMQRRRRGALNKVTADYLAHRVVFTQDKHGAFSGVAASGKPFYYNPKTGDLTFTGPKAHPTQAINYVLSGGLSCERLHRKTRTPGEGMTAWRQDNLCYTDGTPLLETLA